MSIESISQIAQESVIDEDASIEDVATEDVTDVTDVTDVEIVVAEISETPLDTTEPYEEKPIALSPEAKKQKGRPPLHTTQGRSYFLQSEVTRAFKNPEAFADELKQMHALTPEREKALTSNNIYVGPSKTLDFTLYGETLTVMKLTTHLLDLYPGCKHRIRISKSKIVSPKSSLYLPPVKAETQVKNRRVNKKTYSEHSPFNVFVYLSIII